MARPKDQAARREQLIQATLATIATHGLSGTTMKGIANVAGTSPGLVAYYYPDLEDLIEAAHRVATERFYWVRHAAIAHEAEPPAKLMHLIRSGLPEPGDMLLSQALNELSVDARRNPMHATLMTLLFDREVSLYTSVLEAGIRSGDFDPSMDIPSVARNFVVLEDGLGLHLLGSNSSLRPEVALEQLVSYARAATRIQSLT